MVSFALTKESGNLGAELPVTAKYAEGTKVGDLPTPYLVNGIFKGWYYDADKKNAAASNDVISSSKTLYADMIMAEEQQIVETPSYITVTLEPNKVKGFSFKIENYEDGCIDSFIDVADKSSVKYTVNGGTVIPELKKGHTYTLMLTDYGPVQESKVRLVVNGETQPASVTKLNIVTEKEKAMNLSLADGMKYLSAAEVSEMEGNALDGLFLANLGNGSNNAQTNKYKGSFKYTGSENLKVGDKVAIYEGTHPTKRTLEMAGTEEDGNIAYITITSVNGSSYSYVSTNAEEVIKFVEVLPVSINWDDNFDKNNHSITMPGYYINYGHANYASFGFDDDTTIDVDDYIALFSGGDDPDANSKAEGYGRVTAVSENSAEGTITIEYVDATEEEVMASMDLYNTRNADIDLSEEEIRKMEEDIKQQAKASGFLDEAAEYLVALALETDGYKELDDDFDLDLESYNIKFADASGEESLDSLQMMGATASLKKEDTDIYVNIKPGKLNHYKGQNGISVELGMKVVVEFKSDKLKTGHLELEIEACFLEEVLLDVNISGGAVWKTAWIFPYIADYQATANLDIGSFTSVGITATLKTEEDDDDDDDDDKKDDDKKDDNKKDDNKKDDNKKDGVIGNQWEKLGIDKLDKNSNESVGKFIANIGNQMTELATKKGFMGGDFSGDGDDGEEGDTLSSKYAAFIEDSSDSWIPIVKKEIFNVEGGIDPLHILAFSISGDFVVSANLYITMGAQFEVGEAKRYTYDIRVKEKKVTTTVTDLEKQNLTFEFYVFGTAGIRVGLEFELAVGLLSTKLDSVGITAEVGAYAQLWGYFYFKYAEWINDAGVKEKEKYCSGALYFELGFYLEVKFKAQLFSSDKLTYEPTLYENQWPLLTVGDQRNVTGFADTPGAGEYYLPVEIVGKRSYGFTKSLFDMDYLDLKEGKTDVGNYNDGGESHYDISFTNKKFSYNPLNNVVSINVPEGESIKEETEMRIVWTGNALAFTTKPIEKTVKIIWTDPANARMIHFDSMGGGDVKSIALAIGDPVTAPADPTKQGYIFGGWYTDESCSWKFVFPSKMPDYENKSITVYAKWIPRKDTPYTVEHYIRNENGRYVYEATDYKTGETDSVPTAASLTRSFTGMEYVDAYISSIEPDGQSMMIVYYKPQKFDVTFTYGSLEAKTPEGLISEETEPVKYTVGYGNFQYAPILVMPGYVFLGYKNKVTGEILKTDENNMFSVTASETYEAQWTEAENTSYQVKFYVSNPNTFMDELVETVLCEGKTGSVISLDSSSYSTSYTDSKYSFMTMDYYNIDLSNPTISAYGDTVLEFYYFRRAYLLTYMDGDTEVCTPENVPWGSRLPKPENPTKQGYIFEGWHTESSCSAESLVDFNTFIMPAKAMTLYANWVASKDTAYTVSYYLQNAENDDYSYYKSDTKYGTTGSITSDEFPVIDHYVLNENVDGSVLSAVIEPDGRTELILYYDRKTITITFDKGADDAVFYGDTSVTFRYGQMFYASLPTRSEYVFTGWVDENGNKINNYSYVTSDMDFKLTATWFYNGLSINVEHWVMDTNGEYSNCTNTEYWAQDRQLENTNFYPISYMNYGLVSPSVPGIEYPTEVEVFDSDGKVIELDSSGTVPYIDGMKIKIYYERSAYNLTYVFKDEKYASILDGQEYTHGLVYCGANITKPNLEQEGMRLNVASGGAEFFENLQTMPTSDLTYEISYSPIRYTVHFMNNENQLVAAYDQDFEYGTAQKLKKVPEGSFPGYEFLGWTDTRYGTDVIYYDEHEVQNLATKDSAIVCLYAVLRPYTYNIKLIPYIYNLGTLEAVPDNFITNMSEMENLTVTAGQDLVLPKLSAIGCQSVKYYTGDCAGTNSDKDVGWTREDATPVYDYIDFNTLKDGDTIYITAELVPTSYSVEWEIGDAFEGTVTGNGQNLITILNINKFIATPQLSAGINFNEKPNGGCSYIATGIKTSNEILYLEGWYTRPNGEGYKLDFDSLVKGSEQYDITSFPEGLTTKGSDTITFYANWVHLAYREYSVYVHRENDDKTYFYDNLRYDINCYDDAKIPADVLKMQSEVGDFKGWFAYDENGNPIYDHNGNKMTWDVLKKMKVDGSYECVHLYPDIDYDLWLFGEKVNSLESLTMNYAPNAADGGIATFDFEKFAVYLDKCKATYSSENADSMKLLTTVDNSDIYSVITANMNVMLPICITGTNEIGMSVDDSSHNIAAIANHGGGIEIRPEKEEGIQNKLLINISQNVASQKTIYGVYTRGGYRQWNRYVNSSSQTDFYYAPLVHINIKGLADNNYGIKGEAGSENRDSFLIIEIPFDKSGNAINLPVSDSEYGGKISVPFLVFSDAKCAFFGNSVTNSIFTYEDDETMVTTDNAASVSDAHYYVTGFSSSDSEWEMIQKNINNAHNNAPTN